MLHILTIATILVFPFVMISVMYAHASRVWVAQRAAHELVASFHSTTDANTTFGHLVVATNPNGVELVLPTAPTPEEASLASLENEELARGFYTLSRLPLALACNRPESERPNERAEREGLIRALEAWIYE